MLTEVMCIFRCIHLRLFVASFENSMLKPFCGILQDDDKCAKEIKLSYPGYNSNYSPVSNTPIIYELLLEQGVTYDLIIYLKLSDGAEIVFWTQQYKKSSGKQSCRDVIIMLACCIKGVVYANINLLNTNLSIADCKPLSCGASQTSAFLKILTNQALSCRCILSGRQQQYKLKHSYKLPLHLNTLLVIFRRPNGVVPINFLC